MVIIPKLCHPINILLINNLYMRVSPYYVSGDLFIILIYFYFIIYIFFTSIITCVKILVYIERRYPLFHWRVLYFILP